MDLLFCGVEAKVTDVECSRILELLFDLGRLCAVLRWLGFLVARIEFALLVLLEVSGLAIDRMNRD